MADRLHLAVSSKDVETLRRLAVDLGLVGPTGRHKGRGNISALLSWLAGRVRSGELGAGDLAQDRLFRNGMEGMQDER